MAADNGSTTVFPNVIGGSQLYLRGDDVLRLTVLNSKSGALVQLSGRMLSPEGKITNFLHNLSPAATRTPVTLTRQLGEGWLLDVAVGCKFTTIAIGQLFAVLSLCRGLSGNVDDLSTLASGYITQHTRVAWPGSGVRPSSDGRGFIRSVTGTDQAANTDVNEIVPSNVRWRFMCGTFQLVTDANAANRTVRLIFNDGTFNVVSCPAVAIQAASLTFNYSAGAFGAAALSALTDIAIPTPPDIYLLPGYGITTVTTNRQVGDNWGAPQYVVEEWLEA